MTVTMEVKEGASASNCGWQQRLRQVPRFVGCWLSLWCHAPRPCASAFHTPATFQRIVVLPPQHHTIVRRFSQKPSLLSLAKQSSPDDDSSDTTHRRGPAQQKDDKASIAEDGSISSNSSRRISSETAVLNSVSDAEALLACRAHLQRTHRMPWTAGDERKRKRAWVMEQARQPDSMTGFFWEDPDELIYYNRRQKSTDQLTTTHENGPWLDSTTTTMAKSNVLEDPEEEEIIWETVVYSQGNPQRQGTSLTDMVDQDNVWETAHTIPEDVATSESYFKVDDATPSASHSRRSEAAQRQWSNPEWKAAWYERRWRGRTKSPHEKRMQVLEDRMKRSSMDTFLAHPELSTMTESEIAQAIRTYVEANTKRSKSAEATLLLRKESTQIWRDDDEECPLERPPPLPRDSLYNLDMKIIQEKQKQRSEKATRAYRQRDVNRKNQSDFRNSKRSHSRRPFSLEVATHPKNALDHMEALLREPPKVLQDPQQLALLHTNVQLALQPRKLARRKDLFRRLLKDVFDLRGKCVPLSGATTATTTHQFVTNCSINDLGDFVLRTIEKRRDELQIKAQERPEKKKHR